MKISNKLFNDQQIRQFSQNMQDIQKLQSKISSGKNIIFASDDPVGAVELSGLNDVTLYEAPFSLIYRFESQPSDDCSII